MGNIVWIASYPKSGNTWVRAFIENYIANQNTPIDINHLYNRSISESTASLYQECLDGDRTLDQLSTEEVCELRPTVHGLIASRAQGTTFVKTHNFLGEYKGKPLHTASVTSGAIYVVRNPLDVVVSMSSYFGISIDQAIDFMAEEMTGTPMEEAHVPQIISSWSKNVSSWTNPDPSILVLRYEDLLANPKKWFRKVESFLKLKKDPKRLKAAIENSRFDKLKAQERASGFIEKHENAKQFFNKGRANQWRQLLEKGQIERIISMNGELMARFKYLPK
ncbi:MAG: sulfotransferase domain-containing protein [Kangiellaceae bacterium]|nr:sulfotransferase domain-containing protein [Kangiellaceae bacterium]MCW8997376.1 sulfotransferase domain-containing protein [Kangiellaceae bacterium]MCW9016525.1 sulfotransferase domain-containing protein [Kangiellaceae bacterium]